MKSEYKYRYRHNEGCGGVAFYFNITVPFKEINNYKLRADLVEFEDGTHPQVNDHISCSHCGDIFKTRPIIENIEANK